MAAHSWNCADCAQHRKGFLSRLPAGSPDRARCVMRRRRLPAGSVLARAGEFPDRVHAVQEGLVKLVGPGPRGHPRIVDLLGPGDLVGLDGVFGRRTTFDTVAVTELETCCSTLGEFKDMLASSTDIAIGLADHLSSVVDREGERLRGLGTNTAVERVAALLVDGRLPRKGPDRVVLPLRRREVAALLGVAPETIARSLARLSAEGLLRVAGREIAILDVEGLISRADGRKSPVATPVRV